MACNVTVTYLIVPAQENATAWQAQAGGELPARYPGRAHIDPQYMVDASRPNAPAEVVELKDMPLSDRAGVLEAFAETVRTGSPPADFPTGRANLGTLAMVEAALRSAKTGSSPARLIGGG